MMRKSSIVLNVAKSVAVDVIHPNAAAQGRPRNASHACCEVDHA